MWSRLSETAALFRVVDRLVPGFGEPGLQVCGVGSNTRTVFTANGQMHAGDDYFDFELLNARIGSWSGFSSVKAYSGAGVWHEHEFKQFS